MAYRRRYLSLAAMCRHMHRLAIRQTSSRLVQRYRRPLDRPTTVRRCNALTLDSGRVVASSNERPAAV